MSVAMQQTWLGEQDQDKVARDMVAIATSDSQQARDARRYAGDDQGFALWLYLVNRRCVRALSISMYDLSDWTWRDAYENGDSPSSALRQALEDDDLYGSFFDGGE